MLGLTAHERDISNSPGSCGRRSFPSSLPSPFVQLLLERLKGTQTARRLSKAPAHARARYLGFTHFVYCRYASEHETVALVSQLRQA